MLGSVPTKDTFENKTFILMQNACKTMKTIAKYAVDANLIRLGSTNAKKNIQPLDIFWCLWQSLPWQTVPMAKCSKPMCPTAKSPTVKNP